VEETLGLFENIPPPKKKKIRDSTKILVNWGKAWTGGTASNKVAVGIKVLSGETKTTKNNSVRGIRKEGEGDWGERGSSLLAPDRRGVGRPDGKRKNYEAGGGYSAAGEPKKKTCRENAAHWHRGSRLERETVEKGKKTPPTSKGKGKKAFMSNDAIVGGGIKKRVTRTCKRSAAGAERIFNKNKGEKYRTMGGGWVVGVWGGGGGGSW